MTAQYLSRRTYPDNPGESVLFHAAAGGVGLIAGQWLKAGGYGHRYRRHGREGGGSRRYASTGQW
jgi:NADPH:quinone reductase-like Zn-dependent oxidoreductase